MRHAFASRWTLVTSGFALSRLARNAHHTAVSAPGALARLVAPSKSHSQSAPPHLAVSPPLPLPPPPPPVRPPCRAPWPTTPTWAGPTSPPKTPRPPPAARRPSSSTPAVAVPSRPTSPPKALPAPPYPPSIGVPPTNRSGPSSSSSAGTRSHGHGHARRGSVMDLAAEMVGGQAGVEQLEKARKVSDKIEDRLDQLARPIRPWLPGIGRFLIVVTFLEDALRILTQLSGAFPSLPLVHPMSRADSSVGDAQTRTTTSRCALLPRDPSCASSADPPFLVPCRAEAPRLPLGSLAHVPLDQRPRAAPLLASCTLDRPR